ncbi:hypothetical protein HPB52_023598 [Rhipicephalus sanguineus]|uniref:Uncharacterized protein n=1 Tax=Rhipicephalus sanguineus TaxID=34632 RepID=A0A9D4SVB4_RHISA|nr:hypothetical protein HPB52_023598 [Rhipicephalus sanguineus]
MRSDVSECACCDWSIIADSPRGSAARLRVVQTLSALSFESTAPTLYHRIPAPVTSRKQRRRGRQPCQQPEPTVPAPPWAKVQQRSVATWTHQDRQEAPKFFDSDLPWKVQRQVRREMPLERVPWPFCGRTVTKADVRAQGTRLLDPPGVQQCTPCGINVYFQSHFKGSLHVAKTKTVRDGSTRHQAPTLSAPPMALPDQDLAAFPDFAALVGPVLPAATAAALPADDDTSKDLLIYLSENFI